MVLNKTRVAIFGGGPGGMATAWTLSSTEALRRQYEIHIYTMGWRAGGKGTSGRGEYDRIEEHGLHILFGCYNNFFRVMRDVYDSLGRPEDSPLATFEQAFWPEGFGVVEDYWNGDWHEIDLLLPRNRAIAGDGDALNRSTTYVRMLLQGLVEVALGWRTLASIQKLLYPHGERWEKHPGGSVRAGEPDFIVQASVSLIRWYLETLQAGSQAIEQNAAWFVKLCRTLRALLNPVLNAIGKLSWDAWIATCAVDFLLAFGTGLVVDGVLLHGGYDRVDKYDFADWLMRHGMREVTADTPFVRFIYDAAFSYRDGDASRPRCSAGTTVRTLVLMAMTYKGAGFYKMQGGMGDVVFAPLFEVLKQRGVQFHFFHQLEDLKLDATGKNVARATLRRQVRLADGRPDTDYQPLLDCKGLPSWPASPDWSQIDPADRVEDRWLESYYTPEYGTTVELSKGRDFDKVVLATPVLCLQYVARDVLKADRRWAAMARKVEAVSTAAFQVWFNRSLSELGWKKPAPLLSLYVDPFNTWCDMSQVLQWEEWPADQDVRSVSYFCGAQPESRHLPPRTDIGFPDREREKAKAYALQFMQSYLTGLLPDAVDPAKPPTVDWNLVVDPQNREGEARLDAQYWRSNCEPHEQCTLSLPNTNQYRIRPEHPGFENLTIAGDWVDNGLYVACMEGAFVGGIRAARFIAGEDFPIVGEDMYDGLPGRPGAVPPI